MVLIPCVQWCVTWHPALDRDGRSNNRLWFSADIFSLLLLDFFFRISEMGGRKRGRKIL